MRKRAQFVSALSGESILGPRRSPKVGGQPGAVSALSGESILGPLAAASKQIFIMSMFQHSLVSLFWGHMVWAFMARGKLIVSALSGESILGPHCR